MLAGYVLQTNQVLLAALLTAASMGLLSLVEIKASRPYKEMKRDQASDGTSSEAAQIERYEAILKSISLGVILLGFGLMSWRWFA